MEGFVRTVSHFPLLFLYEIRFYTFRTLVPHCVLTWSGPKGRTFCPFPRSDKSEDTLRKAPLLLMLCA